MALPTNDKSRGQRPRWAAAREGEGLLSPANPGARLLTAAEWVTIAAACGLTPREVAVAILVANGLQRKGIARRLGIGVQTVRVHIDGLFRKLEARGLVKLVLRLARMREILAARARAAADNQGPRPVPGRKGRGHTK